MSSTQENGRGGAQGANREVRAIETPIRAAGGQIQGYAAVFNQVTELMPGLREVIRPGAFARTLEAGADVRALWNHNSDFVLGRRGSGTLAVVEDEHGLAYTVDLPDAQWARDAQASIERGDVSQSSFSFDVVAERWTQDAVSGYTLRELLDVELYDVSPVTYPAYQGTTVGVRAAQDIREAMARHIAGQVRGVGPVFVQEIVDEILRQAQQGGGGQAADPADELEELRRAQERLSVRRRRLQLQEMKLRT
jgi:HK97 family phage prohead protease